MQKYIYIYIYISFLLWVQIRTSDNFTLRICCKNIVNVTLLKLEPATTFTPIELASFY